ncbi:MAG TPA: IS630 family transposase [Chloroflexota bacterium]|nr:IS630 family transposase [Chloroflexota bacterium]
MVFVKLTEEQRRELERVSRQAVGRVALRAHMVLLSGRGYSVPQIAQIHDCGHDVVRIWLHRYEREGVKGLEDEPKSGRPPKDPLARHIVDAQAGQSPECSGHVQTCWTVALLTGFLAVRFHLALSGSSVRRYLKQMEWRWARPRLAPASLLRRKRDPDTDAKRAAIADALVQVARGAAHLLSLDECDLHLLPVVRKMWMKGPRVRIPTPGKNAKHAFFGALDAASGVFHWADHDRKLAVHFVAFLEHLAAAYPTGTLYLVLDGAPTHTAKVVVKWLAANPRVQVLWLPKYAGHEDNPAERIWGLMKDKVAANRLAGSIDPLVAAARRFFIELPPHPATLPVAA